MCFLFILIFLYHYLHFFTAPPAGGRLGCCRRLRHALRGDGRTSPGRPSQDPFEVAVHLASGNVAAEVHADTSWTVCTLKRQLQELRPSALDRWQHLLHGGRLLKDEERLGDLEGSRPLVLCLVLAPDAQDLVDPRESVHRGAARALRDMGVQAAPLIAPLLMQATANADGPSLPGRPGAEADAERVLRRLLEASAEPDKAEISGGLFLGALVEPCVLLLASDSVALQRLAAEAIAQAGSLAAPLVVPLLRHPSAPTRWAAVRAAAHIGAPAGHLAARLLADPSPCVRWAAVEALGRIGAPAAGHAGGVQGLLQDESLRVRLAASEALWKLGRRPATDAARLHVREFTIISTTYVSPKTQQLVTVCLKHVVVCLFQVKL